MVIGSPFINTRHSYNCLTFIIRILILVKHIYIETGHWFLFLDPILTPSPSDLLLWVTGSTDAGSHIASWEVPYLSYFTVVFHHCLLHSLMTTPLCCPVHWTQPPTRLAWFKILNDYSLLNVYPQIFGWNYENDMNNYIKEKIFLSYLDWRQKLMSEDQYFYPKYRYLRSYTYIKDKKNGTSAGNDNSLLFMKQNIAISYSKESFNSLLSSDSMLRHVSGSTPAYAPITPVRALVLISDFVQIVR